MPLFHELDVYENESKYVSFLRVYGNGVDEVQHWDTERIVELYQRLSKSFSLKNLSGYFWSKSVKGISLERRRPTSLQRQG